MAVLAVCNHKGGTGKTTTTTHLAAAYGLAGRRVLVVDLDPQGFMTRLLGVEEPALEASALALFNPEGHLREIPTVSLEGFDLLPASYAMTRAMRKLNKPTDTLWVREMVQDEHDYDLILFDTAAANTVFSLNAIVAAEHLLIPVTPEVQPVTGAEQTFATAKLVREKLNPRLQEPLFLLTQVDARKRDHAHYAQYLRASYGPRVLENVIRTHASLAEAAGGGQTVFTRDVNSRGARDYANAADEIARYVFEGEAPPEAPAPVTTAPEWVSFSAF